MFNLNVKTVQMHEQRYNTIGDYWTEGGVTQYRVSSMANSDYEFLVFLHEVIEKQLAKKMGISEKVIDAWDLLHEDNDEPGAMEGCPYREAHLIAEGFERAMAVKLGVDWAHYSETITAVLALPQPPEVRHDSQSSQNLGRRSKMPKGKIRERSVLHK